MNPYHAYQAYLVHRADVLALLNSCGEECGVGGQFNGARNHIAVFMKLPILFCVYDAPPLPRRQSECYGLVICVEGNGDVFQTKGEETGIVAPIGLIPMDVAIGEKVGAPQFGVGFAKPDERCNETENFFILFELIPLKPTDLIVLHVRIVVAKACMAIGVFHEKHRNALRDEKREKKIAHLLFAKG